MKIASLNLKASFDVDGLGFKKKTIVDQDNEERLNNSLWRIGREAYNILKSDEFLDVEQILTLERHSAEMVISDLVDPLLIKLYKEGRLKVEGDSPEDDFECFWKRLEWIDKIIGFLSLMEQQIGHISFAPKDFADFMRRIIASAIIKRIDDAIISEILDGRFLLENVEDINFLYDQLIARPYVDTIGRSVLKLRAQKGANTINVQHKDRQDFVFKWLDANYKDGDTHEDLASRLEPLLDGERKYGTILKDISKWKKERGVTRKR